MCAVPTAPALADIVTEALKQCGWADPVNDGNAPYTRARDTWMEEIKDDIVTGSKYLKSLKTERMFTITDGLNKYSQPSDYLANDKIEIWDGTHQDIVVGATSGTITFAGNEDATDVQGRSIVITSGTGVNQISLCYSYNSTTKIATVSPVRAVTPVAGDGYMIVDTKYPIDLSLVEQPQTTVLNTTSRPTEYNVKENTTTGDIIFIPTPNKNSSGKAYVCYQSYYADLKKLDLSETLLSTLYLKWRGLWMAGLKYRALQDYDDDRQDKRKKDYYDLLAFVLKDEVIGNRGAN